MSSKKLNPFKDFQSDQIQRTSRKIFTAHYPCRNAALNLTPVTGTTNGHRAWLFIAGLRRTQDLLGIRFQSDSFEISFAY